MFLYGAVTKFATLRRRHYRTWDPAAPLLTIFSLVGQKL